MKLNEIADRLDCVTQELRHLSIIGGDEIASSHLECFANENEAIADELSAMQPDERFEAHTKAVSEFLNDLYAIMVDPLAEGVRTVQQTCDELRAAALKYRERGIQTPEPINERLLDALRELYGGVLAIDNGMCSHCRIGYRKHNVVRGKLKGMTACSNEFCVTHKVDAALASAEAQPAGESAKGQEPAEPCKLCEMRHGPGSPCNCVYSAPDAPTAQEAEPNPRLWKDEWIERYGGQALLDSEGFEVVRCLKCDDNICHGWKVQRKPAKAAPERIWRVVWYQFGEWRFTTPGTLTQCADTMLSILRVHTPKLQQSEDSGATWQNVPEAER